MRPKLDWSRTFSLFSIIDSVIRRHRSSVLTRTRSLQCFMHQQPFEDVIQMQIDELLQKSEPKWKSFNLRSISQSIHCAEATNSDEIFNFSIDNNLPEAFGIVSWGSADAMLSSLEREIQQKLSSNKSITFCDIGCGTGLLSVAAYALGAVKVTSLDYNPFSLRLTAASFAHNGYNISDEDRINIQWYDLENKTLKLPPCNLAVISDLMYTIPLTKRVAELVVDLLQDNTDLTILVADPNRLTAQSFVLDIEERIRKSEVAEKISMDIEIVPKHKIYIFRKIKP